MEGTLFVMSTELAGLSPDSSQGWDQLPSSFWFVVIQYNSLKPDSGVCKCILELFFLGEA